MAQMAYKGILPSIQKARNEKLQPLVWEQIKTQMILDNARHGSYTLVAVCGFQYYEAQEAYLANGD